MKTRPITLLLLIFFLITLPFLPSCGFIGSVFSGDDEGGEEENGQEDESEEPRVHELTIYYRYVGSGSVSAASPLYFVIMPVDENGNIPEDRLDFVIVNGYLPAGTVIAEIEEGTYGILLFHDADSNGDLSHLENYVIYYDYFQAGGGFDSVFVYSDQSIFMDMNDDYEWHHVFIVSPGNGELMTSDFYVYGGISNTGSVTVESIGLELDGNELWGSAQIGGWGGGDEAWMYPGEDNPFNEIELDDHQNGWHTLTARGYDAGGAEIDSFSVGFEEYDGAMVFIRDPADGQIMYDNFTVSGGLAESYGDVLVQVYIDSAYAGDGSLSEDHMQWEYSVDIYGLSDGEHTLFVRADLTGAGLQPQESMSITFHIDTSGAGGV